MQKDNKGQDMTDFGRELIITGDVKYIGEGEDPAENPYMKAYATALKEVYQPESSKREDCNCPDRYLLNGTKMGKYCRCGTPNPMET